MVLDFVFEKVSERKIKIIDAKSIETKELLRFSRHKKRGESGIIRESIGYNPSKKDCGFIIWNTLQIIQ